ncbi:dihydroceramide delta(4)-desaturase [Mycena olivaceomarginata]|nr:dihydroceramide delta(4)-desaturase [Mycena olivaceomarginata]
MKSVQSHGHRGSFEVVGRGELECVTNCDPRLFLQSAHSAPSSNVHRSTLKAYFSLFGGAESLTEGRTPRRTVPSHPTKKDNGIAHIAPPRNPADFLSAVARMEILRAHPEVTKLMGHELLTRYIVLGVVALQLYCAFALRYTRIVPNKLLAMFANLPIGVPYSVTFKGYHLEHHKFMGQDGIDVDLPTQLELVLLNNVLGKKSLELSAHPSTFQILFYALRPGLVRSQRFGWWHALSIVIQLVFNHLLVSTLGWRPFVYLLASSFFAGSLHPCAGHLIAKHYLWDGLEQETYSYYGPLNVLAYNVGYHNEHHDFPSIPWTRLPALRALAPEAYDSLPAHPSWPMVIVNFIRDKEVGIFARAKRLSMVAASAAKSDKSE